MVSKKKNSNLKPEIQKLEKKTYKKLDKKTHKNNHKKDYNKLDGGGFFSAIKGYAQFGVAKGKYGIDSTKLSVEKLKIASTASKKGFLGKTFGLKKTKIMDKQGSIISKTLNRQERGKNFIRSNYKSTSQMTQNVKYMKARLQTKQQKLYQLENRLGHEKHKFEAKYSKKLNKYNDELTIGVAKKKEELRKKYAETNPEKVDELLKKHKENLLKRHTMKIKKLDLKYETFKKKALFLKRRIEKKKTKTW